MESKKEIYVDGIDKIHFIGGMIRIDMMSLEAGEDPDSPPVPVFKERIVMPPEGFLRSFDTMQQLINQLMEKGVFKENK
jgi:hypothetical protein